MLFRVVAFKAAVFWFFFWGGGPGFHLEEDWARISPRLTRLLAGACSPFVQHVFECGPRLSLRVFFLGSLLVGSCYHAEPPDLKQCKLAVFASLNAKQRGVGQCWLRCSRAPRWKGPAPHHLTADQAGMLSRVEGSGLCSRVNLNKPSFELLNHPSRGVRMAGGKRG